MTGAAERGPWGTWVMSLIYLGFYANMGVLTRVYLDRFVTLGCAATSWGPCWVGNNWPGGLYGLYTSVLVANMLGCFIIGLLSPAQLLDLESTVACAMLPPKSSWQHNSLLLLGLRTGYCGCLTTFASWMLGLVTTGVPYNRYPDMLFGLLVGVQTSLICVILGQHVAMVLHRHWHGQRFSAYPKQLIPTVESVIEGIEQVDRQGYEQNILQRMSEYSIISTRSLPPDHRHSGMGVHGGQRPSGEGAVVETVEGDMLEGGLGDRVVDGDGSHPHHSHPHYQHQGMGKSVAVVMHADEDAIDQNIDHNGVDQHHVDHHVDALPSPHNGHPPPQPPQRTSPSTTNKPLSTQPPPSSSPFAPADCSGGGPPQPPVLPHALRVATWGVCQTKTDLLHAALFIACMVVFIVLLVLYDDGAQAHLDTRTWFFSVAVAPMGCYLRWQLGRLNFQGTGLYSFYPTGTYTANMLGTAITFGLQCIASRKTLTYWESVVVVGLQTGFCGSLTTVSTWAVEVLGGARLIRDGVFIGYIYALATLLGGIVLGLCIYGWTVWAY